jgi:hypothetical protein
MIIGYCLNTSDWIQLATAIGTVLLAIAAFWTLWQSRKQLHVLQNQQHEERRARLSFEIIVFEHVHCIKIHNVGQEPAYNVHLNFSGPFFDELFSPEIKKAFESFSKKTFCFASGREAYIYLCPMIDDTNSTHIIYGRQFSANQINTWLEQHKHSLITIDGQYCDRYDISEHFTIESFTSDLFLRHENSSTRALQQISKGITCRNDLHRPIQELVDNISKSIDIIQKKISND